MSASEEQYAKAWCTHLLRDQQAIIERMAKLLRDQKNISATDTDGLKDEQTLLEKMATLLRDQQRTINLLNQKAADIPPQQSAEQQKSAATALYHSGHIFGPDSAAITWGGTVRDLVPISIKGKKYRALILTPKFVRSQNDVFSSEMAIKMMEPQVSEEHEYLEYVKKLPATDGNGNRDFPLNDDILEALFTDDELYDLANKTKGRQYALEKFLRREYAVHTRANKYVVGFMRRAFKMNDIQLQEDWKERVDFTQMSKLETRIGRHDDGMPVSDREVKIPDYGSDSGSENFGKLRS